MAAALSRAWRHAQRGGRPLVATAVAVLLQRVLMVPTAPHWRAGHKATAAYTADLAYGRVAAEFDRHALPAYRMYRVAKSSVEQKWLAPRTGSGGVAVAPVDAPSGNRPKRGRGDCGDCTSAMRTSRQHSTRARGAASYCSRPSASPSATSRISAPCLPAGPSASRRPAARATASITRVPGRSSRSAPSGNSLWPSPPHFRLS